MDHCKSTYNPSSSSAPLGGFSVTSFRPPLQRARALLPRRDAAASRGLDKSACCFSRLPTYILPAYSVVGSNPASEESRTPGRSAGRLVLDAAFGVFFCVGVGGREEKGCRRRKCLRICISSFSFLFWDGRVLAETEEEASRYAEKRAVVWKETCKNTLILTAYSLRATAP
jgi:hypothetical protein